MIFLFFFKFLLKLMGLLTMKWKIRTYNFYEYDDIKIILAFMLISFAFFIIFTFSRLWCYSIFFGYAGLILFMLHQNHEKFSLLQDIKNKIGGQK